MDNNKKRDERPLAYPQPTKTDEQLKNQPEFIDQEPERFHKEISDIPATEHEEDEDRELGGEG
ncbi:MAG: hypothetical protein ACJ748_11705 [Flavisolibacter sp.]